MIEVTYTLHGITKTFKVGMDRFDELIAWANKEFTDGKHIGGPDLYQPQAGKPKVGRKK